MFKHSVKVPRLYKIAAKVAKDAQEGIGSIKNLVYEQRKKHPNIKAIYALVTTLFQRNDEIESLLKKSQFLTKEPRANPWLIKILIVELLWGSKRLSGGSIPEKTVQAYEQIFKAHMSDTSSITKVNDNGGDVKPRYVRINTLLISLDEAVEGFRNEGWRLCKCLDKTDYEGFLNKITSLEEDEFLIDIHVPNLLIFPPKTAFYNHTAYKSGYIILQDKASCLPVHILSPPTGSTVLDMCAAPGMKTTQLAAVMYNEGTLYAVERNPKRFETLSKIVESSGAKCVKTENKDVLTCTAGDFPRVEYILVDPSCSGSGMTDRLDFEQEKSKGRIESLAGFQIKILRSALTRYPQAKRVVYSTCSIYPEENEDVVRQVMETNHFFKLVPAKQFVNDTWQNFGSSDYGDIGKFCLYAKPNEDFTNGFFVAVFERLENGEENNLFNRKIYNYKKHVQSQENRRKQRQGLDNDQPYDNPQFSQNNKQDRRAEKGACAETNMVYEQTKEGRTCDQTEEESMSNINNNKYMHSKENGGGETSATAHNTASKKKKRKQRYAVDDTENFELVGETSEIKNSENPEQNCEEPVKRKKKKKNKEIDMFSESVAIITKKKRKYLRDNMDDQNENNAKEMPEGKTVEMENKSISISLESDGKPIKSKKKKKHAEALVGIVSEASNEGEENFAYNHEVVENRVVNSKKKKKRGDSIIEVIIDIKIDDNVELITNKKNKFRKYQENKDIEAADNNKLFSEDSQHIVKKKKKKTKNLGNETC